MIRRIVTTASAVLASASIALAGDMIEKTSPHPVPETMDRLEAAVTNAGATVFARVDHGAGAASVELELAPSQLLIFGNPKLGTPAMQDAMTAGLDLPLRVLAYSGSDGTTRVVYHAPSSLAETHGLPAEAKYVQMMSGALDKLTNAAIAAE